MAREVIEHARLVACVNAVAAEIDAVSPDPGFLPEVPFLAFHTEVYGRHWDVLEWLLRGLRRPGHPLRVAELGVACGPIGLFLLLRFPELLYVGADPMIKPEVREAYRRFGSRAQLHVTTSEELHFSVLPREEQFDLVFVDGPHTFENVRNDIHLWQARVRRGGILAGHDFTCSHPPLLSAVLMSRGLWGRSARLHVGADGVWWWRVPV
eukprot:NODE_22542_length_704_cov_2.155979.p2 GENE.NODE_22542_length_704_cov_2.155979~~NODE_22542_length_704_cov_2.155979.p2  ORF type:complete len:233 (-),score=80.40 NODE_22542_length_704_cov_2.155979:4-630(-)